MMSERSQLCIPGIVLLLKTVPRDKSGFKSMISFDVEKEKLFFQRLRDEDQEAWNVIFRKSVCAVLAGTTKNGVSYRQIARDRDLNDMSVYGMLYSYMIGRGKLENYGFRSPIIYWMRFYVKMLILEHCKKNDSPVSDEITVSSVSENSNEELLSDGSRENWQSVESCFSEMWKETPMNAYVYLLKRYDMLRSKEISAMLDITPENVDTIFHRADKNMKQRLRKEGGMAE